ncbi:hypothetical protein RRX38_02705 [Pseudomonas sp. DTU_2021_1001937_2_SI_NGA_ILE_001]|uniref:hypothetical protein n=1 Tax=Pseudomonas sp. DTU_2021_1001937_2_SI_NGA_ILE_001 TaxID=3077589 RepID=UPI0028FC2D15|nr:hypothetical protein [Pseudomonas sp. DTU_2021_1001937_2_SI_NGA_ILE_001]WNW10101.1 hypothetical protein RRX38_02705 [Pseudomonas sp. DTU_2021_1001937_2_SI_NGA_ILE_001]
MTTPPVKSLVDEQIEDLDAVVIIRHGVPFHEVIGQPRETLVVDLKQQLGATMKGRRIAVRVRPCTRQN